MTSKVNDRQKLPRTDEPIRGGDAGLFVSVLRIIGLAVTLVLGFVVKTGIGILPGNRALLAPFGGTNHPEVLDIRGAALGCKIDVEEGSADAEEEPVLVDGVQVKIHILKIRFCTQRGNAVDVLVGCIRYIQANAAAQSLQHDAVFTDFVGILPLETA